MIPFARPDIGHEEIERVRAVLESGWLTTGEQVHQFERELASFVGAKHAIALNSGTAALHLALEAIGLARDDEVIVPAYTFTATAEVVLYFGARPVLVDVDPRTLNIDPQCVAAAITDRTKAIIPVHFGGLAADLDTLLVPVGGGGLIGGIAAWYAGKVRVVAVEPELAPTLHKAVEAGRPVDAEAGGYAADSLAPRRVGELMFPIARRYIERVVLVTDDIIREAQEKLWQALRVVAEPGGAAALSALLSGRYRPASGERVGVIVSGGNTVAVDFKR